MEYTIQEQEAYAHGLSTGYQLSYSFSPEEREVLAKHHETRQTPFERGMAAGYRRRTTEEQEGAQ